MNHGVFYCEFLLKKDANVSGFLQAAKELNDGYISKQKGYISWNQLQDGDIWADYISFESLEDVKKFEANSGNAGELAKKFYSYLNCNSCKVHRFTVERSYK